MLHVDTFALEPLPIAMRVRFAWVFLLLLSGEKPSIGDEPSTLKTRPNIVYLLCDDLGVGDLKAFNPESKIPTPAMDRLAAQGLRFTDAHSGSAVCTPTRYGIICGRYAWRTQLQKGVLGGLSPSLIAPNQSTVPKFLKENGYHSTCIGKWHLGLDWKKHPGKSVSDLAIETAEQTRSVDYSQPFEAGPLQAGFDEYFGISASLDMVPYVYLKDDAVTETPSIEKSFGMRSATDKSQTRLGPGSPDFTAEDVLPRLTREAIAYLERRSADHRDQPFFLYVPFASPHTPIAPSKDWEGKSGLNPYADFVMQQDECIGRILNALERFNLDKETIVFFTSDNGCSPQADLPKLREMGHDPCRPFRGHKADIYEGGHRVPMIVRWPGVIAPNTTATQTVCLTDLFATVADSIGVPLPTDSAPDSFSWVPLFKNPAAPHVRNSTIHHSINGSFAIRKGRYKLCFCPDSGGWSDPKPKAKPNFEEGLQLFDLEQDLQETTNLANDFPELVKELSVEMEQCIEQGRSTPGAKLRNDVPVQLWKHARRNKSLSVATKIDFQSPKPNQVFQRQANVPQFSHLHHVGKPARGFAEVPVQWTIPNTYWSRLEYRLRTPGDESKLPTWTVADGSTSSKFDRTQIAVSAGGWYRFEIRLLDQDRIVAEGESGPFGVGELFIVAGQSYATNCNDARLEVADPQQRIVAYDLNRSTWQIANDPQPVFDRSDGGSIWPAVGDALASILQVPIGFANVAVGGTSSTQWAPDGSLHPRLVQAGRELGSFRAVLWQQGESDVIEKATSEAYIQRLLKIRESAETAWGEKKPWFLAKSTLHPTVYNDPLSENRIRSAIEGLIERHGFDRGPDTDMLANENRGPAGSRRHFSGIGQKNAAAMWFSTLLIYLQQPSAPHEASIESLSDMHLLEPAWNSSVVFRESSVLLQLEKDGPIVARLAYPASEILSIENAIRNQKFDLGKDFQLSDDKRNLVWLGKSSVEPITTEQMFPLKDAPNSYQHRVGNPDQNLFYAPGRWFHDHNFEVTYRRAGFETPKKKATSTATTSLQRTLQMLRSATTIKMGVSGDSISTGLDASGTTQTQPNQQGYPDLVAAQLMKSYGCDVLLNNRAVSGWSIANGVQDLDAMLESAPDLLIVAYGMNDVGRRDPVWFGQQAKIIYDRSKAKLPNVEIIWVASMLGNKEWMHTPREMFFSYRDELAKLIGPDAVLADLTSVWQELLGNKHDLDLTGNGLNHPNDFGHRLYAQAILQFL